MERKIKRGDIYYANLNPVIGSEQGGRRPVLIISNDVGNKHSPTVIVAPITSRINTKAKLPTHTLINNFEGLDKNSIILLEQVRTIDKQRLEQYLGMIPDDMVARVDKALAISVALEKIKAKRKYLANGYSLVKERPPFSPHKGKQSKRFLSSHPVARGNIRFSPLLKKLF